MAFPKTMSITMNKVQYKEIISQLFKTIICLIQEFLICSWKPSSVGKILIYQNLWVWFLYFPGHHRHVCIIDYHRLLRFIGGKDTSIMGSRWCLEQ